MATRSPKKAPTSAPSAGRTIAKEIRIDAGEVKYAGTEPSFEEQPTPDRRSLAIMTSLNWYSRFLPGKQAKPFMVDYLIATDRPQLARTMGQVADSQITPTWGWVARLHLRGLDLLADERGRLEAEIVRLTNTVPVEEAVKAVKNTANVQEIMRERAREAAGEVEGLLDEFLAAAAKLNTEGRVVSILSERNILPQHISILTEVWERKAAEFTEILESDDRQFKEAWGHYTKAQIKSVIRFCESVLADLRGYSAAKKREVKPRARKPQSPEKIVGKLKFLRRWEDQESGLKLESIPAAKLHGATECYLYDVERRKLIYLVADDLAKTMTVKGTTILGYDEVRSGSKTLRKPQAQMSEFAKLGKPAGRKWFDGVKSVLGKFNGRTNENMVILKAW